VYQSNLAQQPRTFHAHRTPDPSSSAPGASASHPSRPKAVNRKCLKTIKILWRVLDPFRRMAYTFIERHRFSARPLSVISNLSTTTCNFPPVSLPDRGHPSGDISRAHPIPRFGSLHDESVNRVPHPTKFRNQRPHPFFIHGLPRNPSCRSCHNSLPAACHSAAPQDHAPPPFAPTTVPSRRPTKNPAATSTFRANFVNDRLPCRAKNSYGSSFSASSMSEKRSRNLSSTRLLRRPNLLLNARPRLLNISKRTASKSSLTPNHQLRRGLKYQNSCRKNLGTAGLRGKYERSRAVPRLSRSTARLDEKAPYLRKNYRFSGCAMRDTAPPRTATGRSRKSKYDKNVHTVSRSASVAAFQRDVVQPACNYRIGSKTACATSTASSKLNHARRLRLYRRSSIPVSRLPSESNDHKILGIILDSFAQSFAC